MINVTLGYFPKDELLSMQLTSPIPVVPEAGSGSRFGVRQLRDHELGRTHSWTTKVTWRHMLQSQPRSGHAKSRDRRGVRVALPPKNDARPQIAPSLRARLQASGGARSEAAALDGRVEA